MLGKPCNAVKFRRCPCCWRLWRFLTFQARKSAGWRPDLPRSRLYKKATSEELNATGLNKGGPEGDQWISGRFP